MCLNEELPPFYLGVWRRSRRESSVRSAWGLARTRRPVGPTDVIPLIHFFTVLWPPGLSLLLSKSSSAAHAFRVSIKIVDLTYWTISWLYCPNDGKTSKGGRRKMECEMWYWVVWQRGKLDGKCQVHEHNIFNLSHLEEKCWTKLG